MQVLPVQEYNAQQEIKYSQRCKEWKPTDGGFPQAAFFFFSTRYGSFRQTGYVAFGYNEAGVKRDIAVWRPTKKEAVKAFYN